MTNKLSELRQKKDWSRQRLSRISGVSYDVIKRLESDVTAGVGMETGLKLARALKVYAEDIFKI